MNKLHSFTLGLLVGVGLAIDGKFLLPVNAIPDPSNISSTAPKIIESHSPNSVSPSVIAAKSPEIIPYRAAREAVGGDSVVVLPSSLTHFILPAFTTVDGMSLQPSALSPYGLDTESASRLIDYLNKKVAELTDLEAQNSKLVKDQDGNEFYSVNSFENQGQKLKSDVDSAISETFSKFRDDRVLIFKKQLFAAHLFTDFGATAKEISYSIAPDGNSSFSMVKKLNGIIVDSYTDGTKARLMKTRYSKIVTKNQNPN